MPTKIQIHNHFGRPSTRDADVKIVYNKLLGGWYVVRGPQQTPLSGRFNTEEEAKMWLLLRKNARDGVVEEYLAGVDEKLKQLPNASARRRFVEEQERAFMNRYADFQRRAASNGKIYPGETAWAYSETLRGLARRLGQVGDARDDRDPDQSDLNSAARGLNMLSKSPSELRQLIDRHSGSSLFASRVIVAAAKQMLAAKLRMGAKDVGDAPRIEQGLSDDEPRIVSGVRGMKSTPFSKRFKNSAEMERWMDSDDYDNVTVYQIERSQR